MAPDDVAGHLWARDYTLDQSAPARDLPARRATEWLDAVAETWQKADLVEEKSDVIHAVYERIVIEGPRFVGLRLTPAAYATGSLWRCPKGLLWRARQELSAWMPERS